MMLTLRNIFAIRTFLILFCSVLVFAGCTKHERSEEAHRLHEELLNVAMNDVDKAMERVDSAEEAGVFTAVRANTVRASIYLNADRLRMAVYYAEKAIAA